MKVKVNNNPIKKVGPLFLEMPMEALKYEVMGSRTSTLNPDPLLQYAQDFVNIPMGNSYCQVDIAALEHQHGLLDLSQKVIVSFRRQLVVLVFKPTHTSKHDSLNEQRRIY